MRWKFNIQGELSPFKHHMLYFKKGDYCEQNLDSLIYAANNILIIFILVGITVLTKWPPSELDFAVEMRYLVK